MEKAYNGIAGSLNSIPVGSRRVFECLKNNLCGSVHDLCSSCSLMDFILNGYENESYHAKLK